MRKTATVISLSIFMVFLVASAMLIHPFGYPPSQMDDYIIENAQSETGANNAVTSVVFDYRGFDTLGEATILFTAVTGVVMLFRRKKEKEPGYDV
jgi:multisubunit Na+/H+ antiporter MnhB subunit